jgi:ankyrin repeat protein
MQGNTKVATLLVDRSASFDVENNDGVKALLIALLAGNDAAMRLLMDKGANLEAKDTDTVLQSLPGSAVILTDFFKKQGKLQEAETVLRRALWVYGKNIGPKAPIDIGHQITLNDINSLGNMYRKRGQLEKAEEMYQLEIDWCKKAAGPDNPKTLSRMGTLGSLPTGTN